MPTTEELFPGEFDDTPENSGEDFVQGKQEGTGLGTRVKGSVEGAVAGAASGGAIAGVPGAVVGGIGGAVYGGVKPEQTIGAVEGLIQGGLRQAHFDAGEKDANTKLNQINAKMDSAYNKWLAIKDPEFAKLNTPYKLLTSSINPSEVLKNFKKDMLYEKEFFSTPYAQILLTEKLRHLKNQSASSLERTVKGGFTETFVGKELASKVSGMSEEDKKENEDAYTGAKVASEVMVTAAASKLLKPLQKTKLIAETGPKSSLLRKSVSGGIQSSAFGAGYEGTKQLLRPNTLKEKGKKVAETTATFGAVGAVLPVAGAVAGKVLEKTHKAGDMVVNKITSGLKTSKIGQKIVQKRAIAAKAAQIKANYIKTEAAKIKVPTEVPDMSKEISADLFYNLALKESVAIGNLSKQIKNPNQIFKRMQSFKLVKKIMEQEGVRTRILTLHDRIYKLKVKTPKGTLNVGKFLNKMSKDRAELIGKAFVKPELVSQLTPDEKIVYNQYKRIDKIGDKLLARMSAERTVAKGKSIVEQAKKYNNSTELTRGQEMIKRGNELKTFKKGKLTENYLKRTYKEELQESVIQMQSLGFSEKAIAESIKADYGKEIPKSLLKLLMKEKPRQAGTTLYSTIVKQRKLTDKEIEPFINYDIRKVMEKYTREMAKEVADRPLIEGMKGALKMIDQLPARALPPKNRAYIQQLADSFQPNYNLTPEAMRTAWRDWVAKDVPKWATFAKPLLRSIKDPIAFAENHLLAGNAMMGLGFKPAFMLKNSTQPAIDLYLGVPMKHWANAAKVTAKNEIGRQKLPLRYAWWGKEPLPLGRAYKLGTVVPTDFGIDLKTGTSIAGDRFRRAAFFTVRNSDRPNVKRSMIAFYDWGRELGMSHDKARWFANAGASTSEFEYYSNARSVFAKTGIGKPLMMFKTWGINWHDALVHGRQNLYNEFQEYLPAEYLNLGPSMINFTTYLLAQYGAVAAIGATTGLDISGANPDQVLKSTFYDSPVDIIGRIMGLFPVTGTGSLEIEKALKLSSPGRWIRWINGQVDSPLGRTTGEARESNKKKKLF